MSRTDSEHGEARKLRGHANCSVRQKATNLLQEWKELAESDEEPEEEKVPPQPIVIDSDHENETLAVRRGNRQEEIQATWRVDVGGSSGRRNAASVEDASFMAVDSRHFSARHYQQRARECMCPCCRAGFKGLTLPETFPYPTPAICEEVVESTGMTTVGFRLFDSARRDGDDVPFRIGTMVAANSGRPAGACGMRGRVSHVHGAHVTQEEDLVSNWMTTEAGGDARRMDEVYRATIDQKWGMVEADGGSTRTFQGVDYVLEGRRTSPSAEVYRDAWVVRGCRLSVKRHAKGRGRSAEGAYDTARSFPTTLVFVAGPNAGAKGGCKSSSMRRTYSVAAAGEYKVFREGVQAAVRAGLEAMAAEGCSVALLARVGCGLYAGRHRTRINAEFRALVDELLRGNGEAEGGGGKERALGRYFLRVVLTNLS